jgi:hypothetical protein
VWVKGIAGLIVLMIVISITPAFALSELERGSVMNPRLENAFGAPMTGNVNVSQQVQISADITNHQEKSQNFIYLVQIKNELGIVVSLGWISGQLTPDQKLSPSLSWSPKDSGKFTAEIFIWTGFKDHSALSNNVELQINVS